MAGETSIKTSYLSRYITSLQSCRYSAQVAGDKYQLERQHDLLSVDFVKKTDSSRAASSGELVWLPGDYSLQTLALASYPRQVRIHTIELSRGLREISKHLSSFVSTFLSTVYEQGELQQLWRVVLEHSVHTILVTRSDPGIPCPDLAADTGGGPVTVTHRDDEISYHFKAKNFILEFGTSVRKAVKVIYSDSFLGEAERAEESAALVEAVLARLQLPGPVLVLDNSPGPGFGAAFCALVAVAQQTEAEQHCDVYVYL